MAFFPSSTLTAIPVLKTLPGKAFPQNLPHRARRVCGPDYHGMGFGHIRLKITMVLPLEERAAILTNEIAVRVIEKCPSNSQS